MAASGESFSCAADKALLDAAHTANILIAYSCRGGQCGTCRGKLLAGRVEYPNGFPPALSADEAAAGYLLFCSARPVSDLMVELLRPEFETGPD